MSDESRFSGHTRGVVVTTIACLAGIAAALASAWYVGTGEPAATSTTAVILMGAFILVQYPLFQALGIDIGEFGIKDNLYVTFMTFTLWFISYTVLLTAHVQF